MKILAPIVVLAALAAAPVWAEPHGQHQNSGHHANNSNGHHQTVNNSHHQGNANWGQPVPNGHQNGNYYQQSSPQYYPNGANNGHGSGHHGNNQGQGHHNNSSSNTHHPHH